MTSEKMTREGHIVDVVAGRIFPGRITVSGGRIVSVEPAAYSGNEHILPGLIDAHIHIESSMLIPSEFARLAVVHGTTATVSDPHEIANVMGVEGVKFMIRNGSKVPFRFYFGAPSCVPATPFETAGASLGVMETDQLLSLDEVLYLSEMMNFPGVLADDPEVMAKLALAKKYGKPVDGHAPGLSGEALRKYAEAGISTDHECFTIEEAREKAALGMKILIREGSAARNFDALIPILSEYPDRTMFCSDDRHPDDLARRHINDLVIRAIAAGYPVIDVLRACTLNPVRHYNLGAGLLQPGDPADMVVVDGLESFRVLQTWCNGTLVAEDGKTLIRSVPVEPVNRFEAKAITPADLAVTRSGSRIRVIEALEGQLITRQLAETSMISGNQVVSDPGQDILKMVVLNRYQPGLPAVAFARNFGLRKGAIASTVAHDSHNIIAVGVDDDSIAQAVNALIEARGGVCCSDCHAITLLPLPVAGIMSNIDGYEVARQYEQLDRLAHDLGSTLRSPFMTLSFMALLVIPELKLSDKGLFDGKTFSFTSLFLD